MSRRKTREEIFKLLFEASIKNILPNELLEDTERFDNLKASIDKEFIILYLNGLSLEIENINESIMQNMKDWDIATIGNVERTIIRLATYEIIKNLVDYEVAANEAVELAKIYSDEKSVEFINGVLANIIKSQKVVKK